MEEAPKQPEPKVEETVTEGVKPDTVKINAMREVVKSLMKLSDDLRKESDIYMDQSDMDEELYRLHRVLRFSQLSPIWSKLEIILGLSAIWCSIFLDAAKYPSITSVWHQQIALFVLGGYIALAGHRSHLYRSMNRLTAYLRLKHD